jgi:hypothetical protein
VRTLGPVPVLAFALLVAPATAGAAHATVAVSEAPVHSSPDPSSPIIHTFTQGTRLTVSDRAGYGFRTVRMPDGRYGFVPESALALDEPAAPPPPQQQPPPPQPPAAPPAPPPRPPPPPYAYPPYPYPPYRPAFVVDPNAFRHVGFFFRLNLGFGYMGSSTSASQTLFTFDSSHGFAGDSGVAIGGAAKENFIVAGEFWWSWAASPALTARGVSVPNGGTLSNSLFGFGPQFTWYLMPSNVFVSLTPSMTWLSFSDVFGSYQTDLGFGSRFALGKEWWVGPHLGMGVSTWFVASFNTEGAGSNATWTTFEGGLGFSMTVN